MKLQKVSAILGLTVCLIGTQIPGNYAANVAQAAQEEPEGISQGDSGVLDESQDMPVWPDEGSTAGKTTSGQTEGNEGKEAAPGRGRYLARIRDQKSRMQE